MPFIKKKKDSKTFDTVRDDNWLKLIGIKLWVKLLPHKLIFDEVEVSQLTITAKEQERFSGN